MRSSQITENTQKTAWAVVFIVKTKPMDLRIKIIEELMANLNIYFSMVQKIVDSPSYASLVTKKNLFSTFTSLRDFPEITKKHGQNKLNKNIPKFTKTKRVSLDL